MEEDERVLWTIPCDDHAIFIDREGYLAERYGMACVKGELPGSEIRFIDSNGMLDDPYGTMPVYSIIGRRGATIPISRLKTAFAYVNDIETVFSYLEEYGVTVDAASMKQTLEVHFIRQGGQKPLYYMKINMKDSEEVFADLKKFNFFNMENPNCKGVKFLGERDLDPRRIDSVLIQYLYEYSCYRDALVDVEIYFDKHSFYGVSDSDSDVATIAEYNSIVCNEEKKYLGKLRKYVNDTLKEMWEEHKNEAARIEEYRNAKLQVASEYDKDPNLME